MNDITPVESFEQANQETLNQRIRQLAKEQLLQPHQSLGKLVSSLIPLDALDFDRIGAIQEITRRYNEISTPERRVTMLYHFTDTEGAEAISTSGVIGKEGATEVYLTEITPQLAKPLASAEDARVYEMYFRDKKVPQSLREHVTRFIYGLKFKWHHDIKKRLLTNPAIQKTFKTGSIIPVGAHKLEHVLFVATDSIKAGSILKKDQHGEIFVDRAIRKDNDSDFQVFGPLATQAPKQPSLSPNPPK